MALRDEIYSARMPQNGFLSDTEVFNILLRDFYNKRIKEPIKYYFEDNPMSKTYIKDIQLTPPSMTIYDKNEFSRFRSDSKIYFKSYDNYDNIMSVGFGSLYVFERKGSFGKNKIINITSLGEKVVRGLKELGSRDGITFGTLKACYSCQYTSLTGSTKYENTNPQLGVPFAGRDPQRISHSSGGYVYLPIKFDL